MRHDPALASLSLPCSTAAVSANYARWDIRGASRACRRRSATFALTHTLLACRYVACVAGERGEVHTIAYYIGIIDFLQEWTPTKISAYMIKKMVAPQPQSTVPPGPYAEQFRTFFASKWRGDAQPDHPDSGSIVKTR